MNSSPYFEPNRDADDASRVANWAKSWAETFRREAWQPSSLEVAAEPVVAQGLVRLEKQLRHPSL